MGAMAIIVCVLAILVKNEAHRLTTKLLTRDSDEAALCATDPPTKNCGMYEELPGAPEVVRCGMTCTREPGCMHYNYVSTESSPCQLYNYRPLNFDPVNNCQHYYVPEPDIPGCSFPYTYNGGLYYSCIAENISGVATVAQPFSCIDVNYTAATCNSTEFVATNQTFNITIPTHTYSVPVMSVFNWIVIHQRNAGIYNGHRPWADYKAGFGSINGNFWLGLEKVHLLTSSVPYRLRVEVQEESTDLWYSAEYWTFKIGDELNDKYRLDVSGYSGDAGDALHYEGDWEGNGYFGVYNNNGMKFTTYDQDNDLSSVNCAPSRRGGWWYNNCFYACLTCSVDRHTWHTLLPLSNLQTSRMMIKSQ